MELRHLRYFVAVAEELHFGRAARRLAISQPPLSKQIQDLERDLGTPLLHRTSRRVELTEAGRAFLAEARAVLAAADRAVETARGAGRGDTGSFAVGFLGAAAITLLPAALTRFRGVNPRVGIRLREMPNGPALVRALREHRIDLALLRPPVATIGLETASLLEDPFVAVLPRGHALAGADRVHLADLLGEPFVLWERASTPDVVDAVFALHGEVGPPAEIAVEAAGIPAVLGLVAARLGVSLLPASAVALFHPDVVTRALHPPVPTIGLVAAWRTDDLAPATGAFLETLRTSAGESGAAAPRG